MGGSIPLPGTLVLSSTSARFEQFHGTMMLEYAGRTPVMRTSETGNALVFKVVNADAFAAENPERQICRGDPIRWLTLRLNRDEFRLGMLSNEDWKDYAPNVPGRCLAQTYLLDE